MSRVFPEIERLYPNKTVEQYFDSLVMANRNRMILGENCCFSVISNTQLNFGGRDDLQKAMIYKLKANTENIKKWNATFNENLNSLGYYSLDELLLDSGYERVDSPQALDVAWCQTEDDLKTLRPNQPFDNAYYNNGYIFDGENWIQRSPFSFRRVEDVEIIEQITANGIYRMVSS
jgi:hypothetical protein